MFPKPIIESKLDQEIIFSLEELAKNRDDASKYDAIIDRVSKLSKLKSEPRMKLPSLDTVLVVGANIFGIIWLARYEKEHVLTTKALPFVMKAK